MKKLIYIAVLLLSSISFAGMCDSWSYANHLSSYYPPSKTGTYYHVDKNGRYSDGTEMKEGGLFRYTTWDDSKLNKSHWISCSITHINHTYGYNEYTDGKEYCYVLTLNCTVSERMQFYSSKVYYTELTGYRSDGTLKWKRDEIGSTDIYCYDKSGISIVKRVNDPQYCH